MSVVHDSPDLAAVRDALFAADRVVVTTHLRPDGDAIGSEIALARALMTAGKAVLILTNSPRYRTSGVRRGTRAAVLRRRLRTGSGIRIGGNLWYVKRGPKNTRVFKVRGGRVRELGLAGKRLTKGRRATRRLFGSF